MMKPESSSGEPGLGRTLMVRLLGRPLLKKPQASFSREKDNCFRIHLPERSRSSDRPGNSQSNLIVFEDATPLAHPHQSHDAIREVGRGRFSHWGDEVYFSSSDNSNPNTNGRRYTYIDFSNPLTMLFRPFIGLKEDAEVVAKRAILQSFKDPERLKRQLTTDKNSGVCLLTGALGPGGAERQLCYVAVNLARKGIPVTIGLNSNDSENQDENHFSPLLDSLGVPRFYLKKPHPDFDADHWASELGRADFELLALLPPYLQDQVRNLYTHLIIHRPKILHCWLDSPNLVGGIAGWIAGVPRIIVSVRNTNPSHFHFYQPWFKVWYEVLSRSPRIEFTGNSEAGTHDYAKWLKIDPKKFKIIYNGIDFDTIQAPSPEAVAQLRETIGIAPQAPVITGVFRLAKEKRPFLFLSAVEKICQKVPDLKVLIAGIGPLETEMREFIRARGLESSVILLGRRNDIPTIMSASDLVLLTSAQEGTPNVLMEAQWLGKPVVSTIAGGVAEVVQDRRTGFLCNTEKSEPLAERCIELLNNADLRSKMGAAGKAFMASRFSLQGMLTNTQALYEDR